MGLSDQPRRRVGYHHLHPTRTFHELDPQDAANYNLRGILRYRQRDLDAAIADLDRAIALNPDEATADLQRALDLGLSPHWKQEAEKVLDELRR